MNVVSVTIYKIDGEIFPCGIIENMVCNKAKVLETNYQLDITEPWDETCETPATPVIVVTEYIEYEGKKYWIAYDGTTSINNKCSNDEFPDKVEFDVLIADNGSTTMEFPSLKGFKVHMSAGYVPLFDSDEPGTPLVGQETYSWDYVNAIMTKPETFTTDEHIIIVPYKKA